MKILAVSDVVDARLYTERIVENHKDVQLILGCGDLPLQYLEFLVSLLNIPLLYVPGNHDPAFNEKNPNSFAEGCENIDGKTKLIKGINIGGLGGSIRYQPHRPNQYSQGQMNLRVMRFLTIHGSRFSRKKQNLDIMIAHSPPYKINDDDDPAHVGFSAFLTLIKFLKPRIFLHGHVTSYRGNLAAREVKIGSTTVINVYPYKVLELS